MPTVINRHHFKGKSLPDPHVYIGRGTPLGNPHDVQTYGRENALELYRDWIGERLALGDERLLAALRAITPEHHLVCSCAPKPCHGDIVVEEWSADRKTWKPVVSGPLYAITIWQPWAWAIVEGYKDLENRTWLPPKRRCGQPVAIHAGARPDSRDAWEAVASIVGSCPDDLPRGAIVGVATITHAVTDSDSPWFSGHYGWVLADARPLARPVRCKGAQGFWRVPDEAAAAVIPQLEAA